MFGYSVDILNQSKISLSNQRMLTCLCNLKAYLSSPFVSYCSKIVVDFGTYRVGSSGTVRLCYDIYKLNVFRSFEDILKAIIFVRI